MQLTLELHFSRNLQQASKQKWEKKHNGNKSWKRNYFVKISFFVRKIPEKLENGA
jgi:hypothetical protein